MKFEDFDNIDDELVVSGGPAENPTEDNVPTEEEDTSLGCIARCAEEVMKAYQNANKWFDILKEFLFSDLGCVFFASYVHDLAHTMPVRFDKFGDILHTIDMKIPYPATEYIPDEPESVDDVFDSLFTYLDAIKDSLNNFISCTDEEYHGMSCAAEELLNDIEAEYVPLYKMRKAWTSYQDVMRFDRWVGTYAEKRADLNESLNESFTSEKEYPYIVYNKDDKEWIESSLWVTSEKDDDGEVWKQFSFADNDDYRDYSSLKDAKYTVTDYYDNDGYCCFKWLRDGFDKDKYKKSCQKKFSESLNESVSEKAIVAKELSDDFDMSLDTFWIDDDVMVFTADGHKFVVEKPYEKMNEPGGLSHAVFAEVNNFLSELSGEEK